MSKKVFITLITAAFFCLSFGITNSFAIPLKFYWCEDGDFMLGTSGRLMSVNVDGTALATIRTASSQGIRGCTYNRTDNNLVFAQAGNIYQTSITNTNETALVSSISAIAGTAIDEAAKIVYFSDYDNDRVGIYDLETQAVPTYLTTGVDNTMDIEIDRINGKIYMANFDDGVISRTDLDGQNLETVLTTSSGLWGIAVAPEINKIFYSHTNGSIYRADLDTGTNAIDLTATIGGISSLRDIDYHAGTNKIYWIEPSLVSGKIRRANVDGSGAEDVITSGILFGTFLSLDADDVTIAPTLIAPAGSANYVAILPIKYSLGETPLSGSVTVLFAQGGTPVGQLTMSDTTSVDTQINPFSGVIVNPDISSASGFPLAPGTYTVSLRYQDIYGNPVASASQTNIGILSPTPTPTVTPTATPSATPTVTPTPTATVTPVVCKSKLKLPSVKINKKTASVTITPKKGGTYKVRAKPITGSKKTITISFVAKSAARKVVTFSTLKPGNWEFSYTETIKVKNKKVTTSSCSSKKTVRK